MKTHLVVLIMILQFTTINSVSSQGITLDDILSLEDKSFNEAKGIMFGYGLSIINNSKDYFYYAFVPCSPPEFHEDGCDWKCSSVAYLRSFTSSYELAEEGVKFESYKSTDGRRTVKAKNYERWETFSCSFGENYNRPTQRATTFINIKLKKTIDNFNCRNEFNYTNPIISYSIDLQFNDEFHWKVFKRRVIEKAEFMSTFKKYSDVIEVRYGIRRRINKGGGVMGVYIKLYETDKTYHASISFDSFLSL
ncbi:MAG: hypothetical protein P8K77_05840 [Polaribacter sp.]|nr:hypothetical protein [Polaribacter sp.]